MRLTALKGLFGRLRNAQPERVRQILARAHSEIELALWAILLAWLAWLALFILPNIPEARARAESQRQHEIEAEDNFYCAKFGHAEGTPQHAQCLLDLGAYRTKVEQRLIAEIQGPL